MVKSVVHEGFFRIVSGTWKTFSKCWLLLVLYREIRKLNMAGTKDSRGWGRGEV